MPPAITSDFIDRAKTLRLLSGLGLLIITFCLGLVAASAFFSGIAFKAYIWSLLLALIAGFLFLAAIHVRIHHILGHSPQLSNASLPTLVPAWMTICFAIVMGFIMAWPR